MNNYHHIATMQFKSVILQELEANILPSGHAKCKLFSKLLKSEEQSYSFSKRAYFY